MTMENRLGIFSLVVVGLVGVSTIQAQESNHSGVTLVQNGTASTTYTVQRGDTLWDITRRYYGNPYEWPRVWSYNPEITNPHWIYPLDRIRLGQTGAEQQAELPQASTHALRNLPPQSVLLRDQAFLDDQALQNVGVVIGSPEENMLLSTWDDIYVRFEDGAEVQPGREYTIFRAIPEEERRENEHGKLVRIFGTVHLQNYDQEHGVGRGTITEALDPIERGFRIAPIPRRFEMVPPRENTREMEGEVIATLRSRDMSADNQLIFVNVGEEQGVLVGNRFFVVRVGDEWRQNLLSEGIDYGQLVPEAPEPDEEDYPAEVVAEGRVVDVRSETSTVVVTRSIRAVVIGDKVEMRQGF